MSPVATAVEEYLALRRGLGFELQRSARILRGFARYLDQQGASHVSTELALRWAKQPAQAQPVWWASRLAVVRRFAQYLSIGDPRTEIPPLGLLPFRYRRKPPYLYSDGEVRALVGAAASLTSPTGLRAATYSTLLGLLAVSGLRISEAIGLEDRDVDLDSGVLTIRRTKFGKSRLVPLHASTTRALRRYVRLRDRLLRIRACDSFFVSERGRRLNQWTVRWTFNKLSRTTGLRAATDRHGPRLHDFRHRFAVKTLVQWYRRGVDVERQLPVLSTYLGHGHVTDTYWYLTAVPQLLRLAAERLEARRRAQP